MKDLHEDDIIGSVRERMGRYEETPSEAVWERIAALRSTKDRAWPLWVEMISLVGMGVVVFSLMNVNVTEEAKQVVVAQKEPLRQQIPAPEQTFSDPVDANSTTTTATTIITTTTNTITTTITAIPTIPAPTTTTTTLTSVAVTPQQTDSAFTSEKIVPPYKKPKNKLQFFLSITPSLSFQKITPSGNDALIVQGFESRSPMSIKRFGFSIDAGFQRDINNTFGFYGGISFYRQHQQLTYYYYDKDADVTRVGDAWTFEIIRQQDNKTFDYSMTNIGVSSGLLVTLKGEKLKHKFGAGLIFSQGFARAAGSYNNSRSGYLSYQLFYRSEVMINDHFSWFAEPTFIYSFISKEKLAEPFVLKPYRAGITAGVLYRF